LVTSDDDRTPVAAVGGTTTTTGSATTTDEAPAAPSATTTTTAQVAPPASQPETAPPTTDPQVAPPPADTTPPTITSLTSQRTSIQTTCNQRRSRITAQITGATTAVLRWSDPALSGSKPMTSDGDTWTAVLGPFDTAADDLVLDYTVDARDAAGNLATRSGTIGLTPCPQ
jgi:hypothetical protein